MVGRPERPLDPDAGPVQRFAAGLRKLRQDAGLPSYRRMSALAHYSVTALADAARGERLPTLPVTLAYVDACGGDRALWEARWREIAERLLAPGMTSATEAPPYLGLAPFQPEDAIRFFGRDELVAELVCRADRVPIVAVTGASGSGKSSLLRAGLIPAMAEARAAGQPLWRTLLMTPTDDPLREVAECTAALSGDSPEHLVAEMGGDPAALDIAVRSALAVGPEQTRVLLVVDQFEEVFTLCGDESARELFVDALVDVACGPGRRTTVVLGIRADFYSHVAGFPSLVRALQDGDQLLIGPATSKELRAVIVEPAARAGLVVQHELVATILADVAGEPGALPLVSHALLETWQRRQGRMLTLGDYHAAGGVRGAIAQTAEREYTGFTPSRQQIARRVFLRLTALGEGTEDTRRRVSRDELASVGRPEEAAGVLERLAARRLIVLHEETVEVAHEAVIRAWPRLHRWLTDDREGVRVHRRLTEAARAWESLNREPGALYRGARLEGALDWAARPEHGGDLTPREAEFLAASKALAEAERAALIRRARVLKRMLAALIVLFLAAVAVGAVALRERAAAQANHRTAVSRQLAAQAEGMARADPELAMLLSLAAFRIQPTTEARGALLSVPGYPLGRLELRGHSGQVNAVTFSPNGRLLASAGIDRTLGLWDLAARTRVATLTGHTAPVRTIAFTPDGTLLASAGRDGTVILWDVATRTRLASIPAHQDVIHSVAFSPDGARLATASEDHTIMLWDVRSRTAVGGPLRDDGLIRAVGFSPDGTLLASGGGAGAALWNARTFERLRSLPGHIGDVWTVAFSPDGRLVATAGEDRLVKLWNPDTGSLVKDLADHPERIRSVAFSPAGRWLASASYSGAVYLWDVQRLARVGAYSDHTVGALSVAFSSDGTHMATSGYDENIIVRTPLLPLFSGHTDWVHRPAFSPDGQTLASSSNDRTIRLWDAQTGTPRAVLEDHKDTVTAVAYSPDGGRLASAGRDRVVSMWDMSRREVRARLNHKDIVIDVVFSPDGRFLATAGGARDVSLWHLTGRTSSVELKGHTEAVNSAAFSPDGRLLATASYDRTVVLWDVSTHQPRHTLRGHKTTVQAAVFSPDGRTLASGGADSTVRLWDVGTGRQRAVLKGHTGGLRSLAYSPDGRTLASAGEDRSVILWDVAERRPIATLRGHNDLVDGVAFSPEGRSLVSGGKDHRLIRWRLDPATAAGEVCRTAGRELSEDEWSRFVPALAYQRVCA